MNKSIGKNLPELLSPLQSLALYWLLSNENDECVAGLRQGADACFKNTYRTFVGAIINAAVETIFGRAKAGREVCFVPRCYNRWRDRSHWCAVRLRATPTDQDSSRKRAERVYDCLSAYAGDRLSILERCGNGDWQLWAVSRSFSAHLTWQKLLMRTLDAAGIEPQPEVCELLPSLGQSRVYMPAPGSWDPRSGTVSRIIHANFNQIIPGYLGGR